MSDHFYEYHPFVNFLFFVSVILLNFVCFNPLMLTISLAGALIYASLLNLRKLLRFVCYLGPFLLLVIILNLALRQEGGRVLFTLAGIDLTEEALVYGISFSLLTASVMTWVFCYYRIVAGDKLLAVINMADPRVSLGISRLFRAIPIFLDRLRRAVMAQKTLGLDLSQGGLGRRIGNGINILKIMYQWTRISYHEANASMRARGYGLPGRKAYKKYQMTARDSLVSGAILCLLVVVVVSWIMDLAQAGFPHVLTIPSFNRHFVFSSLSYSILCFLPVFISLGEEIRWRYWKSGI